jgi:hypothetical protein
LPGNEDSPIGQGKKIAISFDGYLIAFSTKATNPHMPSVNIVIQNMTSGESLAVSMVPCTSLGHPTLAAKCG